MNRDADEAPLWFVVTLRLAPLCFLLGFYYVAGFEWYWFVIGGGFVLLFPIAFDFVMDRIYKWRASRIQRALARWDGTEEGSWEMDDDGSWKAGACATAGCIFPLGHRRPCDLGRDDSAQ